MVVFTNDAGFIGLILNGLTQNVTGNAFFTLLMIFILFVIVGLALRIPPIGISMIYLPLLIVMASMTSEFTAVAGAILIYVGYTIAILIYPN